MPASRRGAALVALITLIVCLVPAAPGARADELLVMPYTCRVTGGRVLLMPGPERGHRIVGHREQRKFTACSPANPGMCRNWTVYRFDLDCDGERVPWVEIVAAAGEADRRAWLVDGRLQLRMAARWNLAPDDPCRYDSGRDGDIFAKPRRRRYCAERLAQAPPAVVEMPPGFAPMLGLDAIFVRAAPGVAKAPPPPPTLAVPHPSWQPGAEQAQPTPPADPPPARPAGEASGKPTPPAKAPPPPQSIAESHAKGPPPPEPKSAAKAAGPAPAPPAAEEPKAPAPAPAPKIAAAPPPAKEVTPPKQVAPPPPAHKVPPAQAPAPARTEAEAGDEAAAPGLFSFGILRTTTAGVVVVFAGLTLGLFTAFAVARRRERRHHAAVTRQRAKGRPRLGYDDGSEPPGGAPPALHRVPGASAADAALEAWGERMPHTRMEAFKVLGIGAAPGADAAAIKKIVDALRVNWHPDRARDEPDRQLRELRSKQINAAWDLLQGERAEA
jgi:hypothetical protein